jgi:hypothetical protein
MRNLIPHLRTHKPTPRHRVMRTRCVLVPLPFTPPPPPNPVVPLTRVVRPYVLHAAMRRQPVRSDRSVLGLELLLAISEREVVAA